MPAAAEVEVRFFASAREAAGVGGAQVPAGTAAGLTLALTEQFGERLGRVMAVSTLLIEGRAVSSTADEAIPPGSTVDVLPPFAGG